MDFDADGDLDVYNAGIVHDAMFRNDGDVFTRLPGSFDAEAQVIVFATLAEDFDQDGFDDLYYGRWTCQDTILFGAGDANGTLVGAESGIDARVQCPWDGLAQFPYENTMGLAALDLFDDGFPDLYVGTGDPHNAVPDLLFCHDGERHFRRCSEVLVAPDDPHLYTRGHGAVQADFDRDGDGDVLLNLGGHPDPTLGHDGREVARLFLRDSGAHADTTVLRLRGTVSNRDAVGARITVHAGRTIHRTVRSTMGFQSQSGPEIIVPVSGMSQVSVDVAWPSGRRSRHVVAAHTVTTLVEP